MNALEKIDFAISETYRQHPEYTANAKEFLNGAMFLDFSMVYNYITSKNGARQLMSEVTKEDIIRFVLTETVKIFNAIGSYFYDSEEIQNLPTMEEQISELISVFPEYSLITEEVEFMAKADRLDKRSKNPDERINLFIHYKTNYEHLKPLADIVASYRYQRGEQLRKYIDQNGTGSVSIGQYQGVDLASKIQRDSGTSEVAKNVQINQSAINKCLMDVLSGAQLKSKHNQYALDGTLYASQDTGRRREQEDSVLILTHPKNPEFKLMVVSDGMGGVDHGEIASQYTVQELARWFETLPAEAYFYAANIQQELNKKLSIISKDIYERYNKDYKGIKAGATVVAGVIGATETIISTIGDSRAYITSGNGLKLLTSDESLVWPKNTPLNKISVETVDDLRFNEFNNQILRCIGYDIDSKSIQTRRINNNQYDRLILLTDGVTDLLSQERIWILSHNEHPEKVAELLVKEAISKRAIRKAGADEYHKAVVEAGKDNATAAVYIRR